VNPRIFRRTSSSKLQHQHEATGSILQQKVQPGLVLILGSIHFCFIAARRRMEQAFLTRYGADPKTSVLGGRESTAELGGPGHLSACLLYDKVLLSCVDTKDVLQWKVFFFFDRVKGYPLFSIKCDRDHGLYFI
jgi:hypothetical protein